MATDALLAFLGMGLVTYGVRAGGLALAGRLPRTGRAARWLEQIPGAVLAALVAPAIASGGIAETVAAIATAATAIWSKNLLAAMAVGVLAVWSLRALLGG